MTRTQFTRWYVGFILVVFLMQVFPLYQMGNRAKPIVLGLPFSMFWIVLWIAITFVGLLFLYRLEQKVK